jgi:MFS superfamily sulfate permease-like transporter
VRDRIAAIAGERRVPPRLIVLFMGNVPQVDLAGAELLGSLRSEWAKRHIAFRLAEVRGQVRDALHRLGTASEGLLTNAHQTVDDVVAEWQTTPATAAYAGRTSAGH